MRVKLDHKLTGSGTLAGTALFDDATVAQPDSLLATQVADQSRRTVVIGEYSHVFGPAVVNVSRVGISRTRSTSGEIVATLNPALADTTLGFIPGLPIGSALQGRSRRSEHERHVPGCTRRRCLRSSRCTASPAASGTYATPSW
jgi:hypothetical protein